MYIGTVTNSAIASTSGLPPTLSSKLYSTTPSKSVTRFYLRHPWTKNTDGSDGALEL